MINLDITFCVASKCPEGLKKKCGRCLRRVTEYMQEEKLEVLQQEISLQDFSKDLPTQLKEGVSNCEMFIAPEPEWLGVSCPNIAETIKRRDKLIKK